MFQLLLGGSTHSTWLTCSCEVVPRTGEASYVKEAHSVPCPGQVRKCNIKGCDPANHKNVQGFIKKLIVDLIASWEVDWGQRILDHKFNVDVNIDLL
jgi:hypothetical protein